MRITYLLQDTTLFGGTKVPLQQANLMIRRGHDVTVVTTGGRPDWFEIKARFVSTSSLGAAIPESDVIVATFWTTIEPAIDSGRGQVLHYCQGAEFEYTHNAAEHPAILRAYGHQIPGMVVSPHLGEMLDRRFRRPSRFVPQPLEEHWKPRVWRWRPGAPARLLVTSPFEIDWKGVATSLEAVTLLRKSGLPCRLIRLSQWPLTAAEENLARPDEYHANLKPAEVSELMRGCDLLLAASWEQEGFGLPVVEAMSCGVPVVASDISAFRAFASSAALLVPPREPAAFASAAEELLTQPGVWRAHRRRGLEVAKEFREARSATIAEETLEWAKSGAWRQNLPPART